MSASLKPPNREERLPNEALRLARLDADCNGDRAASYAPGPGVSGFAAPKRSVVPAKAADGVSRATVCSTTTVKTACEREETSLMRVAAVVRHAGPHGGAHDPAQSNDGQQTKN